MSCCLLTEIAASPVVALLLIKKEMRFNHCGEATFVMLTAAADERKRCLRGLKEHQKKPSIVESDFFFPESV